MSLTMTLGQYQQEADQFAIYPGRYNLEGLTYVALGLAGEAGEFANKVKKILRRDPLEVYATSDPMKEELGDILWYVQAAAEELGYSLSEIAQSNLEKLADRRERGVIRGVGDMR